jgi:hypothetical protein
VSEWFEHYMMEEDGISSIPGDIRLISDIEDPTLHKCMLIMLSRTFDYKVSSIIQLFSCSSQTTRTNYPLSSSHQLKSEDLLELTNQDTILGLATVVGVLEEGFQEITTIRKKRDATNGKVAQWEQGVAYKPHEKKLVLQMCRLLVGFTQPGTYFKTSEGTEKEHSIDEFNSKINQLLALTLDSELVEKVTEALCDCVFPDEYSSLVSKLDGKDTEQRSKSFMLTDKDHKAIISMQGFLHNLYLYANEIYMPLFRQHLLVESRVTPDMILPYLHSCLVQCNGTDLDREMTKCLASGICASLKTLVISTFRAPASSPAVVAFTMLNPSQALIQSAWSMIKENVSILVLLLFFNININSMNIGKASAAGDLPEASTPHSLLHSMAAAFCALTKPKQEKVLRLVGGHPQLPVARDVESFALMWGMLTSIYNSDMHADSSDAGAKGESMEQDQIAEEKGVAARSEEKSLHKAGDNDWNPAKAIAADSPCKASSIAESKGVDRDEAPAKGFTPSEDKSSDMFRLLGDLPSLLEKGKKSQQKGLHLPEKPKHKQKEATKKDTSKEFQGVPTDFLCAINRHIMKDPVRSSTGQLFEKATIDLWLERQGSVCPITGDAMNAADLKPDPELKEKIMQWHIKSSMVARTAVAFSMDVDDDDDDLYEF